MRPAEGAVVETAHQVLDQRRTRLVDKGFELGGHRQRGLEPADADTGAHRGRGQVGHVLHQPPGARATERHDGGDRGRISAVAAKQADQHIGRRPPARRRGDGQPLGLEHRPLGHDTVPALAAATGSSGRGSIGDGRNGASGGRGVAPHRRATTVAATAARRRDAGVGRTASATRSATGPGGSSGGSRRSVPSSATVTSSSQAAVIVAAALTLHLASIRRAHERHIGPRADVEHTVGQEHGERDKAGCGPLGADGDGVSARRGEQHRHGVVGALAGDRE